LPAEALIEDAFRAIARDGAGIVEVAERLHLALAALAAADPGYYGDAARRMSRQAAERSEAAMSWDGDLSRIEALRRKTGLAA
jgi:uncharacterized membrane protein